MGSVSGFAANGGNKLVKIRKDNSYWEDCLPGTWKRKIRKGRWRIANIIRRDFYQSIIFYLLLPCSFWTGLRGMKRILLFYGGIFRYRSRVGLLMPKFEEYYWLRPGIFMRYSEWLKIWTILLRVSYYRKKKHNRCEGLDWLYKRY